MCPLHRWAFCHVTMHDAPTFMGQDNEHEQLPEGYSWQGEEIAGNQVLDMGVQEGLLGG
jgi:hypothetical protein